MDSQSLGGVFQHTVNVQKALQGIGSVGIESGTEIKFSLRAGQPVYSGNRLIGILTLGMDISSNSFVDRIRDRLGVACTIFQDDMRVSTTIVRDGQQAVGTKMDNPSVLGTVLREGREYHAQNSILGVEYDTMYWPLRDANGKIAGMFFIGTPRTLIEEAQANIFRSVVLVSVVLGAIIILGSAFFARSLSKPIGQATAYAQRVADGKLDEDLNVKSNDEVGVLATALGRMVASLREMISKAESKTREAEQQAEKCRLATDEAEEAKRQAEQAKRQGMLQAAEQIDAIVERLTAASHQLSGSIERATDGAEQQNARAAETATAMEEMNSTVIEVAKNASHSASDADKAKAKAQEGNHSVEQVIASIGLVQRQAEGLQTSMSDLGRQAEDIGRIMQVIEDIADQTNLLALNAAIEAARAGDAGRGFAVVADEVRKLAEKTMNATKEVGQAISAIQEGARRSVADTREAAESVARSTTLAEQSGTALAEIVEIVSGTAGQVASIATAAEQQSATSEEINRAVDDISRIANETSELMSQSTRAVAELSRQAKELQAVVQSLNEKRLKSLQFKTAVAFIGRPPF